MRCCFCLCCTNSDLTVQMNRHWRLHTGVSLCEHSNGLHSLVYLGVFFVVSNTDVFGGIEKKSLKQKRKRVKKREEKILRKRVSEWEESEPFLADVRMCSRATVTNRLIFTCGSYCAYCAPKDSIVLQLGKQSTRSKSRETEAHLIGNAQNVKQRHCSTNSQQ